MAEGKSKKLLVLSVRIRASPPPIAWCDRV
jgi:hypothetical protein